MPISAISTGRLAAIALAGSVVTASASWGQADPRALDALSPPVAAPHHPGRRIQHPHHAIHRAQGTAVSQTLAAVTPPIPAAPPAPPVFKAPVINVPLHPQPPPPPVPVVANAEGAAGPIPQGIRLGFGSGSADMNASTIQAVQHVADRLREDPEARAQINAYAAGTEDDPSTPRRTALQRGLAARAILINAGVPSTRIYVRAIGQPHDDAPADRIDLTVSTSTQQASKSP